MNTREQRRAMVLNRVEREGLTGEDAAGLMGLSLRQVRRLLAAYRKEGVAALAHGNRGRPPAHRISEDTRNRVVTLAQGAYQGLNHYHLQEVLAEREELVLSRSSLWRILTTPECRVHGGADRPSTANAESAIPRRGCCSKWTGAATTGCKVGVLA